MKYTKKSLKEKLRKLDKELSSFSFYKLYPILNPKYLSYLYKKDLERKEIRQQLKSYTTKE